MSLKRILISVTAGAAIALSPVSAKEKAQNTPRDEFVIENKMYRLQCTDEAQGEACLLIMRLLREYDEFRKRERERRYQEELDERKREYDSIFRI